MSVTIHFRKADKQDIYFLLTLRRRTMDVYLAKANIATTKQYHLDRIEEFYADSNIIVCDDQAIGLIKLALLENSVHIRQFQILPEFQNRGIGQKVLAMIKRKANNLALPITLNVLLDNPAKRLYLRMGYQLVTENDLESKLISPFDALSVENG